MNMEAVMAKNVNQLTKVVERLMTVVGDVVKQVNNIEERLDGGAPAKVDRRTEAPCSGSRGAQNHLMIVK